MSSTPAQRLSDAIRAVRRERVAVVAFITAGFPSKERFAADLTAIASEADVVEIGVPFTDPDGRRRHHPALQPRGAGAGREPRVDPRHREVAAEAQAQLVFMGYLNPMLAYGLPRLAADAAAAGISGFIVPDLPIEESAEFEAALAPHGLALIRMVTPVTPQARLERLTRDAQGFIYAVSMTGTTGRSFGTDGVVPGETLEYLSRVRKLASVPVCAGFGIREHAQVAALAPHVDGVVVGSAVIEAMEKGASTVELLQRLRG